MRQSDLQGAGNVFVLLDDSRGPDGGALLFAEPVEMVVCDTASDVPAALDRIAEAVGSGLHAAGFLAYELGYTLEPKLLPLLPTKRSQPLIWMGLFEEGQALGSDAVEDLLAARAMGPYRLSEPTPAIDRSSYLAAVRRVQEYIAAGDVYQINLTFKLRFAFEGDRIAFYRDLRRKQRVHHGALVCTGEVTILSLSPELFLAVTDGQATARPMKGTATRVTTPAGDRAQARWLSQDEKSRAENLMIVDLLRNDLGRVAEIGSIAVSELFDVETYATVHQMVSTITGRLRPEVGFGDLVRGLFPCGSITGAPKVRAMEVIRELETGPRGIYTGAIGHVGPDGTATFNVAIRTVVLEADGRGEMGIGSGVVFDSDPAAEHRECLMKAQFLTEPYEAFQLIETLRWTAEGYFLRDLHLARLTGSAASFGFRCNLRRVEEALDGHANDLRDGSHRVRLLLSEDGAISISSTAINESPTDALVLVAISDRPVNSDDRFLYHKTTRRQFYEDEIARLSVATGCDEVVFTNERGEVTEGSRTNLFVDMGDGLVTPPVESGLLPGTFREHLVANRNPPVREGILTPGDLAAASRIYVGNAVRGLMRAALIPA